MYLVRIKEEIPEKKYVKEYEIFTTEKDKLLNKKIKEAIKEGKKELEIENAYGERNPDLITLMSINFFKRRGIKPVPGLMIELSKGVIGTIKTVSGGRVIIDLNHPLAGEKVRFFIEIKKTYNDEKEFFKELLDFLAKSNKEYEKIKESVEIEDKILLKNKDYEQIIKELIDLYGLNLDLELKKERNDLDDKKEENKNKE